MLYIFARFEPKPGKRNELLAELTRVLEPTRAEAGCLRIHLYESMREPTCFFIHSEWTDEAAFEAHVAMSHTQRLGNVVEELITHPFQAFRTTRIG